MIVQSVEIEVPLGPWGEKEQQAHNPAELEVHLNPKEQATLRRIVGGLKESDARLSHGQGNKVESGNDAIAWILEAIATAPIK